MAPESSVDVENWLSRIAPATARMYELWYFMAWRRENGGLLKGYTPDQLVEYKKAATNGYPCIILDLAQRWVQTLLRGLEMERHSDNSVRSFAYRYRLRSSSIILYEYVKYFRFPTSRYSVFVLKTFLLIFYE